MSGDARQRLNWATASEWAFILKHLVLPKIDDKDEETLATIQSLIDIMLRKAE